MRKCSPIFNGAVWTPGLNMLLPVSKINRFYCRHHQIYTNTHIDNHNLKHKYVYYTKKYTGQA